MNKRYVIGATFLAASLCALGVTAGSAVHMLGSDTLFDLTQAVIAQCPGVGPGTSYLGTGSVNGQNAMTDGRQQIAPMSRFLNSDACSGAALDSGVDARTPASQAEGLVIALDAVIFAAWNQTGASDAAAGTGFTDGGDPSVACNGPRNIDCHDGDPEGAAHSRTITYTDDTGAPAAYTFQGWRDVLRVLLAGFDHSAAAQGTAAMNSPVWRARDCNSALRRALADNYGNFFENNCVAPAGSNAVALAADSVSGHCSKIRHVFRPDDYSGTTDSLVALLGLPGITLPSAKLSTGASPFCNAVRPAFVYDAPQPTCLQGSDFTWVPTNCISNNLAPIPGAIGPCLVAANIALTNCHNPADNSATVARGSVPALGTSFDREKGVYRAPMQDNDPIRRPCAVNEQNCDHSKSLGLVVPMTQPIIDPATQTNTDRYPLLLPVPLTCVAAPIPEIFDAIVQNKILGFQGALCPNGDFAAPDCRVPAMTGTPNNPSTLDLVPSGCFSISPIPVPAVSPRPVGLFEGRQYNAHLYKSNNGTAAYLTVAQKIPPPGQGAAPNGVPLQGAYYRIHSTKSLNPNGRVCTFPSMTDQIGCLVEASPCSIGYASRTAALTSTNPNTDAIKINAQSPETLCVAGSVPAGGGTPVPSFRYPLSRKVYLSSIIGFPAVNGEELQFAGCETDLAQSGLVPTPAGIMTLSSAGVVANGFINIPSFVNGGEPFCEDFNENMLCNASTNSNACAGPHVNFSSFPTFNTICGNGIREAFEDCDCGTTATSSTDPSCAGGTNGGSFCSTTCRFVN